MKSYKTFFVYQDTLLAYLDIKDIYIELKKFSDQIHTMRLTTSSLALYNKENFMKLKF